MTRSGYRGQFARTCVKGAIAMGTSGISIDRRDFLLLSASGVVTLAASAGGAPLPEEEWAAFMTALEQIGDQLPATSRAEQDAYIYGLASRALRVDHFPTPKVMGAFGKTGIEIGQLARTEPSTDIVHGIML